MVARLPNSLGFRKGYKNRQRGTSRSSRNAQIMKQSKGTGTLEYIDKSKSYGYNAYSMGPEDLVRITVSFTLSLVRKRKMYLFNCLSSANRSCTCEIDCWSEAWACSWANGIAIIAECSYTAVNQLLGTSFSSQHFCIAHSNQSDLKISMGIWHDGNWDPYKGW